MRSFGLTVAAGVAGSGLAALAATKDWWTGSRPKLPEQLLTSFDSPVTNALALVVLASWGVVLVTRGRFRRFVAALAVLAAAGGLLTIWTGLRASHDVASGDGGITGSASLSWWPVAAGIGLVTALLAALVALRLAATWPEMSKKYDAPATVPAAGLSENLDVWKALDQGLDPTESRSE